MATLLAVPWSLATLSLLREAPTVDEVVHLPAGISYWQTRDFRIYPHNPPLVKLVAALPLLSAAPVTDDLYTSRWWREANKTGFAHDFALLNAERFFDLFARARLLMPWIGVVGGLLVFLWSRRLYGNWGGLLSLTLWSFCPNILAHTRLITTDVAATVAGFGATFAFWTYLKRPSWTRAALAGLLLGVAQLTKFSSLLLYGVWPVLWLIHEWAHGGAQGRAHRWARSLAQGAAMVALSVLTINAGYGFAEVGRPLGSFDFTSDALTAKRVPPVAASGFGGPSLREGLLQYRVNRFRGTWLGALPAPLPSAYLTGFDDQKMEAEGVPARAGLFADDPMAHTAEAQEIRGYPVYLNGVLRSRSWWYYYLAAMAYKVPEGTWVLVLGSLVTLILCPRARASWADEITLLMIPGLLLGVMSFGTNIALGLRYVLPLAPFLFVSTGKLARWAQTRARPAWAAAPIVAALSATVAATATIHPHYLAYFNWASGGPDRGSEHLIDSNLDWGQDLLGLKEWLDREAPGRRVGIAYFGQINPAIFAAQGPDEGLDWFLPPALPGTLPERPDLMAKGPEPGLYAISASLVRGLPWRVYAPQRWAPYEAKREAFGYFRSLEPIARVGHSIFLYEITPEQSRRLARVWAGGR